MSTILADMNPRDFWGLLREMKRYMKTTLPFEARQTTVIEMLSNALFLMHKKKAPPALVSFIKHNLDNIKTDADCVAFYRHCAAIYHFIVAQHK